MDIAKKSYQLIKDFPKEERFGLSSQITKSAVSIPSNVAEGSSRTSEKDQKKFIEISLGSAFELETQLMIAESINYGQKDLILVLMKDIREEQKMIVSFLSQLKP